MLTPDRLRTALDTAGIGHTIVRSLGHPDRWVTACAVSIEDFARVVERDARAEVEPLVKMLVDALADARDDSAEVLSNQKAALGTNHRQYLIEGQEALVGRCDVAVNKGRAWLAEKTQEAPHGTPS